MLQQLTSNSRRAASYEADPSGDPLDGVTSEPKIIAYYLPQFHPIPLNDVAWGRGFTEWTNVAKALPRYVGHYQPRLPSALGFYDLRRSEVLREQAALARRFGIYGFCFHYYWFSGERVLDTPLNNLLASPDIDLPFCINWANESWTRTWDGAEHSVIIKQRYEPGDAVRFADEITPILRDPRYIRIDGKPLVLFYRPGAAPDANQIVQTWRRRLQDNGVGECFVVMPQAFGAEDPTVYGIDAACGFPPHHVGWNTDTINGRLEVLDPDFTGEVHDYQDMANRAQQHFPSTFVYFPGVCPGWDNEARRPGRGTSFHGSTPAAYEDWLSHAIGMVKQKHPPARQVVFLNAWNEWAEGAHLEPDQHNGYAYLAATARAVRRAANGDVGLSQATAERQADPIGPVRWARLKAARAADRLAALLRS